MKQSYEPIILTITAFDVEDVIITSGEPTNDNPNINPEGELHTERSDAPLGFF